MSELAQLPLLSDSFPQTLAVTDANDLPAYLKPHNLMSSAGVLIHIHPRLIIEMMSPRVCIQDAHTLVFPVTIHRAEKKMGSLSFQYEGDQLIRKLETNGKVLS